MKLREIRLSRNLTALELGEMTGLSDSQISLIENGKRNPSYDALLKLAEALGCIVSDIVGDRELADLGFSAGERAIIQKYRTLDEYGKRAVEAVLNVEAERGEKVIDYGTIRRYLSRPAAGVGGLVEGEDYEDIPRTAETPREADFALVVSGDSMEPYIHDGETVYINEKAELRDLDVGVFCVDGATYVKQYAPGVNEYYLLSANTKRGYITIKESGNQSVQYFGKVILKAKLPRPIYET